MKRPASNCLHWGYRSVMLAASCATMLCAPAAQAQGRTASGKDGGGELEEIVVTAQRRETSLQTTAIAASVLTGEELEARGVDDLAQLQYAAPSLNLSNYGSANVFNIRGVGRSKVDIEVPSGVVIYQDGVPAIAGYFQNEPYYDIKAIEVLRGPQGTFVGKSASGGAVFIRTQEPIFGENSGYLQLGGGDFSLFEAEGAVNVSASDTFAFRAAVNFLDRDDYYDRITGPFTGKPGTRDLQSLRVGLRWKPTEALLIDWRSSLADLDFGGNVTSSFGTPLFDVPQDAPFKYKDKSGRHVLNVRYQFNNGVTLSSLTGYQKLETVNQLDLNGAVQLPRYWFLSAGEINLWSQEFNLISPDDQNFRWVLGAFAQNQKGELLPVAENGFVFIGGPFFPNMAFPWLGSPWIKDEDDRAVFGHVAYDISEALEIAAGVRYSDYSFFQVTDYVFGTGVAAPTIPFPFGRAAGPVRRDKSENSVDWKLALNWQMNDDQFFYGIISRGHTTGSINIFPPFQPYKEMEVLNYEAGWKATWASGQFTTQTSLYYENIDGYQAAFRDLDLPQSAGQFQNAESDSKIYGVEFTGQARFGQFSWDFGVSWNKSKLGDFNNVVNPLTQKTVDLTGAPFPFAPDFTANIGLEY
ncbi:MAG: TonB-dependent receptor, partial [Acidimicrobiia bacterium]